MMKLRLFFSAIIVFISISGCYELTEFNGIPIRQYADKVIGFSSQYSSTGWSASRVLGKQNVFPNYGDLSNAWASLTPDGKREFLVLGFDTVQTVITIEIYETWHPGSIDTVYLRDAESGKWKIIYSKLIQTNLPEQARVKSIYLVETPYLVNAIRIAMNSPAVPGWNEIDAVAITGERKSE